MSRYVRYYRVQLLVADPRHSHGLPLSSRASLRGMWPVQSLCPSSTESSTLSHALSLRSSTSSNLLSTRLSALWLPSCASGLLRWLTIWLLVTLQTTTDWTAGCYYCCSYLTEGRIHELHIDAIFAMKSLNCLRNLCDILVASVSKRFCPSVLDYVLKSPSRKLHSLSVEESSLSTSSSFSTFSSFSIFTSLPTFTSVPTSSSL